MPRRLAAPALADDAIRLEPLTRSLAPDFAWVLDGDPDVARFTLIPTRVDGAFLDGWLSRYQDGWENGSCAGFAARDVESGAPVGFAAFVQLDLERQEGEIGYAVAPAARGRGVARRAVDLLTRWGFDELGLERIELHIDPANAPSTRIAARTGYRLEGVYRNRYFKEGRRSDLAVWARLRGE